MDRTAKSVPAWSCCVLALGCAGSIALGCTDKDTSDSAFPPAMLPDSIAARLKGGARVDVLWPPNDNWAQSYDDLAFRAEITDLLYHQEGYDSANIGLWSDNAVGAGKHAPTTLDTSLPDQSQIWQRRVTWPTQANGGGKPDLFYQFYWPVSDAYYIADGDSQRNDMFLHGNVKVAEIQLYSVTSGPASANANIFAYREILDNERYFSPDVLDNLTDAIFRQCGDGNNNGGLQHWQVRLRPSVKGINIPQATDGVSNVPCTDLQSVRITFCPGQTAGESLTMCSPIMQCMDDMIAAASPTDNSDRVSVFHLTSSPLGTNASFVWTRPGGRFKSRPSSPDRRRCRLRLGSDCVERWRMLRVS